jgi:rubrerythrin
MKYILIILLSLSITLTSCGSSDDKEKLLNVYKQILIARNSEQDSLKANEAVQKVLKKNGYTELQFRKEIFQMASSEKDFLPMIDSLRNYVKDEQKRILNSSKKKKGNNNYDE